MIERSVRQQALELLAAGDSQRSVARQLGVAKTTVECWANPRARARRAELKRIRKAQVEAPNMVPNERLRAAVQASDVGAVEICERIGWTKRETTQLARALGQMPTGRDSFQTEIEEDLAVKILRAIHVDPWEIEI